MNTTSITTENNKTTSKSILLIPVLYFKYVFLGLKAILFDFWVFLFNMTSYGLDSAYRGTKHVLTYDEIYERTKGKRVVKEKKYN